MNSLEEQEKQLITIHEAYKVCEVHQGIREITWGRTLVKSHPTTNNKSRLQSQRA